MRKKVYLREIRWEALRRVSRDLDIVEGDIKEDKTLLSGNPAVTAVRYFELKEIE